MSMSFDTKIAIVVRDDLPTWQKLNVTAYVASALVGGDLRAGRRELRGCVGQFVPARWSSSRWMIYAVDEAGIRKAYRRAMERGIQIAIFTRELFSTGNDIDNRAAVRAKSADELDLVGLAMRDQKKEDR